MSIRVLEEVTCDKCGQVYLFEKFRVVGPHKMFRVESVEEWLDKIGWRFSDGLRTGQFCPSCKGTPHPAPTCGACGGEREEATMESKKENR